MVEDTVRLDKAANLVRLAILLASTSEGVTVDEIAARFEVTRRTAERMRDAVRDLFPGFETIPDGKRRRFRIQGGMSSFMVAPTVGEIAELEGAAKAFEQSGQQVRSDQLRNLRSKISSALRDGLRRRMEPDMEALCRAEAIARQVGPRLVVRVEVLHILRQALIAMTRVRFNYPSQKQPKGYMRTVVPFGLLFGRQAYLVGCEAGKSDPVLWRLDRITEVTETDLSGVPPDGFDLEAYAAQSFGTFQEPAVDVVLRFDPHVTDAVEATLFHPSQQTRRLADGRLEVQFRAGGQTEMAQHLFTWGDAVEIVRPGGLRDLMVQELEAALARHRKRPTA